MSLINYVCILVTTFSTIISIFLVFRERKNTDKTLLNLKKMLDCAIDGSFKEEIYDETKVSAIESQMGRYLASCVVSSKNIKEEKEKISTLISDISHQTKTPVSNILLYSQLLSECQLNDECKELVNNLIYQSQKLSFLIGSLVKTSRLETGIISVLPKKNSVGDLIYSVINQAIPKAQSNEIEIICGECDYTANFDMKWTMEAVYNILDNAIKYSSPNSKITVETKMYEMFCRIDIKDSGIGIEEFEQSKIFARFYRSISVADKDGVGIGLFLAREIIFAQQGYVKVKSQKGKGSIFSVFLPTECPD